MPSIDYATIKSEVQLMQALRLLGWEPSGWATAQLRGPCPVHHSAGARSRIFAVDLIARSWYCHRCRLGGSVLDLWAAVHGLTLYDAAVHLCRAAQVPVPYLGRSKRRRPRAPRAAPLYRPPPEQEEEP